MQSKRQTKALVCLFYCTHPARFNLDITPGGGYTLDMMHIENRRAPDVLSHGWD